MVDEFRLGDWMAVCSMCGRDRYASEMVKNWQGQWRCPEHNEDRHPQEYVRAVPDIQTPPWTQPPSDVFAVFCDPLGTSCICDYAVADCAICDFISPLLDLSDTSMFPVVQKIFLTIDSVSPWQVPADWDPLLNSIEVIGGGSGGELKLTSGPGGGGGGAYSRIDNVSISGFVPFSVGVGGVGRPAGSTSTAGGDTYFGGSSLATSLVGAQGGQDITSTGIGSAGGDAAAGVGTIKQSGGKGGDGDGILGANCGGGGGGAAGPFGDGGAGGDGSSGIGGGGGGGADGGIAGATGAAGGAGGLPGGGQGGIGGSGADGTYDTTFNGSHGCGGGGGGDTSARSGGYGGDYGGGAGGGSGSGVGNQANGGPGLIIITYVPLI